MHVLKVRFRDKQAFLEAYDDELPFGGLFCPTTTSLEAEERVLVEVHFPELSNKTILRGSVVSWRAALPRLRVRAGAVVAFDESEREKKDFILAVATGERGGGIKRRHARVPVKLPVRWRLMNSNNSQDAWIRDISIGGAQLLTSDPIELESDLVIDLKAPGGAQEISIVGKVSNSTDIGYGIRFIYRDGGGSRRLREVVRRLTQDK